METTLMFLLGVLFGYIGGVLAGRRSIVREAQALVNETIMEIRKGYKA
jgi:hypothetical protein